MTYDVNTREGKRKAEREATARLDHLLTGPGKARFAYLSEHGWTWVRIEREGEKFCVFWQASVENIARSIVPHLLAKPVKQKQALCFQVWFDLEDAGIICRTLRTIKVTMAPSLRQLQLR
jgi:hypothetical protein